MNKSKFTEEQIAFALRMAPSASSRAGAGAVCRAERSGVGNVLLFRAVMAKL